jgi:hypothetical protein
MIKVIKSVTELNLKEQYHAIEHTIHWSEFGVANRQTGLQYLDGEDPWTSAVGKSQGKDLEYTNLNPTFKNTIFETLINDYNLTRTRFMWVGPNTCYSMHRDVTPRIHIPIITNDQCFFVFKRGMVAHLQQDFVCWVDTRQTHTFINCSAESRLHLVGVVKE